MPAVASRGKGRRTVNEINMVPFIDVMLVLLIIFMVTAPMLTPSTVELPSVGMGKTPDKRFVLVVIDPDGAMRVKNGGEAGAGEAVDLPRLVERVQALQGQADAGGRDATPVPVVIGADKNVKYDSVLQVMDKLQRAGVQRVGLSVQKVS